LIGVAPAGLVRPSGARAGLAGWPRVGIVVLNWNRPDHTIACLTSLRELDYPSYEVVVVDNGSADGSPTAIRRLFPGVSVVENGRNLGFAAGSNVGIVLLARRGVDYVLLLNDDAEVATDLLGALVEVAEADPSTGILGPTIYYYGPATVIWSAGGSIDARGRARHLRLGELGDAGLKPVQDVDYVTGCALLVRREVVERVGALDERFFAYYEEAEWCARARRAGFRVVYVPRARAWHKIDPAARNHSRSYLYLTARNRLLYLRCAGAGRGTIALASLDLLRTACSWSLRPKHRAMRPLASALVRGVADFAVGRFGPPPGRP